MEFFISAEGCEPISGDTGAAIPIPRVGETIVMRKSHTLYLCDTVVELVSYDFYEQRVEIRCVKLY